MLQGHVENNTNTNNDGDEELVTVSVFAPTAAENDETEDKSTISSSSSSSDDDDHDDEGNEESALHEPFDRRTITGQPYAARRRVRPHRYYHHHNEDASDEEGDEHGVRQCRSPPNDVPLDALMQEVAELQAREDRVRQRTTTALSTAPNDFAAATAMTTCTNNEDNNSFITTTTTTTTNANLHNARWEQAKARLRQQAATTVMPAQRRSAEWDETESEAETVSYAAALSPLSYDEYISEEDLRSEASCLQKRRPKVIVHEVLPWYTEWMHSAYNWIRYLAIANAHLPGVNLYEANNPDAYFKRNEYTL